MPALTDNGAYLDDILLAVKARLMAITLLPSEAVLILAKDEIPIHPAEQYVWIRPKKQRPDIEKYCGGGRYDMRQERDVAVVIRSRRSIDTSSSHEVHLTVADRDTSAGQGHLRLEHLVLDALIDYFPADADGRHLVTRGLFPVEDDEPEQPQDKNPEWLQSDFRMLVCYRMRIPPREPS